jgi:hypothetical protein
MVGRWDQGIGSQYYEFTDYVRFLKYSHVFLRSIGETRCGCNNPPQRPPTSMFNRTQKNPDVLSHWYTLVDDFQYSTADFYAEIEKELTAREVPRLTISRVEYLEGSVFSDKREYLRLARERYAFDVCAAPFGRIYFFSLRLVEIKRSPVVLVVIVAALLGSLLFGLKSCFSNRYSYYPPQPHSGTDELWLYGGACAAILGLLWNLSHRVGVANANPSPKSSVPPPAFDLDLSTFVLDLPIIGDWYESIRKDTYYRHDTRLMYLTLVSEIVKKKVEEVTAAKGVKLLETHEHSPILADLYKPTTVALEK